MGGRGGGGGGGERVTLIGACVQAEFLNGTKNRTSGHVQFETCEVYHGVLVLFCRVSLSYSYIGHCPITFGLVRLQKRFVNPGRCRTASLNEGQRFYNLQNVCQFF